jgi:group I intron endonuclease
MHSFKKSNKAHELAFTKNRLENFSFIVYIYYKQYETRASSHKALTDLETKVIQIPFDELYNYMKNSTSLHNYKHTVSAKAKMVERFQDKNSHPFWGKHHTNETKLLISKPGETNPMYGRLHSEQSKKLISLRMRKPGVRVYNSVGSLVLAFNSNVEAAALFTLSKSTIGRYIKSGKIYNELKFCKP